MRTYDVIKRLRDAGWNIVRINGSHRILANGTLRGVISLGDREMVGVKMLRKMEKQFGVSLVNN